MRIGRGAVGLVADRACGRVRPDPVRLVPFPPRRPLRRRREHHRHSADDLRDHAARSRRAAARRGRARPAVVVRWRSWRSAGCFASRITVAAAPGAVAMMPSMPPWAFGAIVAGWLWLCLWTTRMRLLGLRPGRRSARPPHGAAPTPDLLVTGDGRHLVVVGDNGTPLILRERAGDYVRQLLAEASGFDGDPEDLGTHRFQHLHARCLRRADPQGRKGMAAARDALGDPDRWAELTQACAEADIVVSDRRLPRGCAPRWLKLDAPTLGGPAGWRSILVRSRASTRSPIGSGRTRGRRSTVRSRSTPRARFPPGSMKWKRRPPGKRRSAWRWCRRPWSPRRTPLRDRRPGPPAAAPTARRTGSPWRPTSVVPLVVAE